MPKVSKVIRQFDGGINSFSDARDLDDKTASEIKNFSVRNVGKLKPIVMLCIHSTNPWIL